MPKVLTPCVHSEILPVPWVDGKPNGKYRKLLRPFSALPEEAHQLRHHLEKLRIYLVHGQLTPAQYTTYFVLLYGTVRAYGLDFAEDRRTARLATALSWLRVGEPDVTALPPLLTNLQLRGMPAMIFSTLRAWLANQIPLQLNEKPVSAHDMLAAQAAGWRYVTVDYESALAGEPIGQKRDAFEFALHDIGHAWAFYNPAYDPVGQAQFFAALKEDLPLLEAYAVRDNKYSADLEYGMGDMNSHPEHLRQYLQGVTIEMLGRQKKGQVSMAADALLRNLACLRG